MSGGFVQCRCYSDVYAYVEEQPAEQDSYQDWDDDDDDDYYTNSPALAAPSPAQV
jgi:hypothetical protein